jgi:hypothetical protein
MSAFWQTIMLPLNGNVVHLSLNSLSFNAFQVETSLFSPSKKPTVSSFECRPYTDYKKFESSQSPLSFL